ncbi:MAG: hypothetical protein II797_00790 [Clostridia bacterium]|nr:hypothetical protein [Clostridia bacterium]
MKKEKKNRPFSKGKGKLNPPEIWGEERKSSHLSKGFSKGRKKAPVSV